MTEALDNMQFKRWIIERTITGPADNGWYEEGPVWVCIGKGYSKDITEAHMYSTEKLANQKVAVEQKSLESYIKHTGRTVTFKLVECNVSLTG
jgi:hypothetical protein